MATSRLQQLANTITASVAEIEKVLAAKKVPSPSFAEDDPRYLPLEATEAQDAVIDAATELRDLLMEPMLFIHGIGAHNNSLCQEAISRYGIAAMVPSNGQISFKAIAEKTGLDEQMLARILRHAITMRIFREPEPGMLAHTKASKILVDPVTNDWLLAGTGEMWPAATKVVDALAKFPKSDLPNQTGFCLANDTTASIYEFLGAHPERAVRFGHAMAAYSQKPEHSPSYIVDAYEWNSLGNGLVVHVGGGTGAFAAAIAQAYPSLNFVVQDMEMMMGPQEKGIPEALRSRVKFEPHDFFASQTTKADVYYFRWSLRNWADSFCLKALQALEPGLRKNSRLLIQDVILPEPGKGPLWKERNARSGDLALAACFNSKDRTLTEWKNLVQKANAAFRFKQVIEPLGSALGIIEFVWEADS